MKDSKMCNPFVLMNMIMYGCVFKIHDADFFFTIGDIDDKGRFEFRGCINNPEKLKRAARIFKMIDDAVEGGYDKFHFLKQDDIDFYNEIKDDKLEIVYRNEESETDHDLALNDSVQVFCEFVQRSHGSVMATRVYNSLKSGGVNTVADLLNKGTDISKFRNLGRKTFKAIFETLIDNGYSIV